MKRIFYTLIFLLVLAFLGVGGYVGSILFEGSGPVLVLEGPQGFLGQSTEIAVKVRDERSGVREVSCVLIQGDRSVALKKRLFQRKNWWEGTGVHEAHIAWQVQPSKLGLHDGGCKVLIEARDASLRSELKGNLTRLEKALIVDTTPPRASVLSRVHNVREGGSGLVTFKVNEPVKQVGVQVGDHFFTPYSHNNSNVYSCLFAVPIQAREKGMAIFIVAEDRAGNSAKTGFSYSLLPFRPKPDRINITDGFLRRKMPEFAGLVGQDTSDLLKVFLAVNHRLRKENNEALLAKCGGVSGPPMWKGGFKALNNAAKRAGFGDFRHYFYRGKEIDQAYHMGVDLASVKNAPVPAANDGRVVFTGDLGIYGDTVVIDHGAGLCTSYSHLNSIEVSKGDVVAKGNIIGQTDTTGLAGGDHLHFGVIVQGVFVNPIEWLDARWIRTHIEKNIEAGDLP